MTGPTMLPSVLLWLATLPAAVQTTAPVSTVPDANPGRPTVSTPAALTPLGYLQFENGVLLARTSGEFSSQFSVNQVTKLTVHPRVQLLALFEPVARSRADGVVVTNPGGTAAGAQVVLLDGGDTRPTVAVSYVHSVYGGSAPDIDIGSANQSAMFLVSDDVAGFHIDVNAMVNDQPDERQHHAQYGQTLSISHAIGNATIAGEVWHFSQPLTNGQCAGTLWALSYPVRNYLVIDGGFNRGLTSSSTRWEFFAGLTYLLPRALWKTHAS